MKKPITYLLLLLYLLSAYIFSPPARAQTSGKVGWSSMFYTGWTQSGYPPATLPWSAITHLIHFSLLSSEVQNNSTGTVTSSSHSLNDTLMKAAVTEAHKQGRKILLSIGGAEDTNWNTACNSTNRSTFISKMITIMQHYGYDGIDLDIEQDFGSPSYTDYIACVSGIRTTLNQITPRPILTEDGDPDWQATMLSKVWQYVDQVNLMSYWTDAGSIGSKITNYTNAGIPKSILGIGIGTDEVGMADTSNPTDCSAKAQYAITNGIGGIMEWTVAGEAYNNNGQYPCSLALASYVSTTSMTPTPTVTGTAPIPTRTPTPSSGPTPTSPPASGTTLIIYDNAIENGFIENAFGYSSKNACDTTTFVSSPCSYAITYTGWGGIGFTAPSNIVTGSFSSIDYNLNTNGQPISDFSVLLLDTSGNWINQIILSQSYVTQTLANGWVHISIPMAQFSSTSVGLGAVQLKNALNQTLAAIHVDDISLVANAQLSNSPTPAQSTLTPTPAIGNGDTNADGKIDSSDIRAVITSWLQSALGVSGANQYGDTSINSMDFGVVVAHLPGATPTPTSTPTPLPSVTSPTPTPSSTGGVLPMNVISRGVPVFASSQQYPAANANDADYTTTWRSNGPAWIAYNLANVPVANRKKVILVWYNDDNGDYDHTFYTITYPAYNLPGNYTIEANAAAGGTSAPTSGWVPLATVTNNHYHSRQHALDLTGYNWVRMNVTAVDGSSGNTDVDLNMDIHDASQAPNNNDDWIFFGDSITAGAMNHDAPVSGTKTFAQMVNAQVPTNFPVEEGAGIGFTWSTDGVNYLPTWLPLFPGKYVGLSYGTNDSGGCNPTQFYNNYVSMVQMVLNAGKIPVVPHMPWGKTTAIQTCGPQLNAKIDALYNSFPQIIHGPDLWAFFQANPSLISSDNIHPSPAGMAAYRQQWANAMVNAVYK